MSSKEMDNLRCQNSLLNKRVENLETLGRKEQDIIRDLEEEHRREKEGQERMKEEMRGIKTQHLEERRLEREKTEDNRHSELSK